MGRPKKQSSKNSSNKDNNKESRFSKIANIPRPELNLASDTKRGISVVVFAVLAIVSALSLAGVAGSLGEIISKFFAMLFGFIAYLVPVFFGIIAIVLFRPKTQEEKSHIYFRTYLGTFLMCGGIAGLIHIIYLFDNSSAFTIAAEGKGGGFLGAIFAAPAFNLFGFWAGLFVVVAILLIGILVTFNVSLRKLLRKDTRMPINKMATISAELRPILGN